MSNINTDEKSAVQVAVRVRPINHKEVGTDNIVTCKKSIIYLKNPEDKKKKSFTYDYIYDIDSTQESVYNDIGTKIVDHAFNGYNTCVFAYGQTGCFAKGTRIATINGTKNVEDIVVGDHLVGDDLTQRTVLKLCRGRQSMFEIIPVDSSTNSNTDHFTSATSTNSNTIVSTFTTDSTSNPLNTCTLQSFTVNQDHIMVIYKNGRLFDVPLIDLDHSKIYTGAYRSGVDIIPYAFCIKYLQADNYYGFAIDGNCRFLHECGIVLHNSGKSHTMMGSGNDLGLIPKICDALFDSQNDHVAGNLNNRVPGNSVHQLNNLDKHTSTTQLSNQLSNHNLLNNSTSPPNNSTSPPNNSNITYKIELSYLEIYAEEVYDLLIKSEHKTSLKIRQHPEFGPYVEGLSQILIENSRTARKLIDRGNKERITAATLMNARSSRSHAILTVHFTQIITDTTNKTREIVSKINLVDLAGSEKVEMSGVTGINFKEAININKSLSTLGLVIGKLALLSNKSGQISATKDSSRITPRNNTPVWTSSNNTAQSKFNSHQSSNSNGYQSPRMVNDFNSNTNSQSNANSNTNSSSHVPFRDSALTWILKESLGGNSKTYMIATVSPSIINYNESLSTLRYAANAKQIINNVRVNEDPNDKLIRMLTTEVEKLKEQLILKGSDDTTSNEELKFLKEELQARETLLREKDKTWEQKLNESKRLSNEEQDRLKQDLAIKQDEYKRKIEAMDMERMNIIKELELLRSSTSENNINQKSFEEELAKKQAEFEKCRIIDTAVSLQEYYEQKITKLKLEYESKLAESIQKNNTAEIIELQNKITTLQSETQSYCTENKKLNDEIKKIQERSAQQTKQFANERILLTKQIQQLHSKIYALEHKG
jgi:hypothetical protein